LALGRQFKVCLILPARRDHLGTFNKVDEHTEEVGAKACEAILNPQGRYGPIKLE